MNFAEIFRVGYFNWWLVGAYILLLAVFLFGILRPRRKTEWKSAGVAQAWVVALYAEMYGVPLTAYLAMNILGRSNLEAEHHYNGHLWPLFFNLGEQTTIQAQFVCTVVGQATILIGALLAVFGWRQLHRAAKEGKLANSGLYKYIRHPQYTGFFLFLIGSMINWPTLITFVTLPILIVVYLRLAKAEEQDAIAEFGDLYRNYMAQTGRFFPKLAFATR